MTSVAKNKDELVDAIKSTYGRMVAFNTSSPYKNARGRIRKWKKGKKI